MNRRERRSQKSSQPKCRSCGDRDLLTASPFDGRERCPRCHPMHMKEQARKHEEAEPAAARMEEIQRAIFTTLQGLDLKQGEEVTAIHAIGHLLATLMVQAGGDEVTARERMAAWVRSTMVALQLPVESETVLKMPAPVAELVLRWRRISASLTAAARTGDPCAASLLDACADELTEIYAEPESGSLIIKP